MSIDVVNRLIAAEICAFRQEVEDHLAKYPMGIDYFGMKATRNPRLVKRLRNGDGVEMPTIERVRAFMKDREAKILAAGNSGVAD